MYIRRNEREAKVPTVLSPLRVWNQAPKPLAPARASAYRQVLSECDEIKFLFHHPTAVCIWADPRRRFQPTYQTAPGPHIRTEEPRRNVHSPYPAHPVQFLPCWHAHTTQYGQSDLLLISGMSSICNEMTGLWFISTRYSSTSMHAQSIASHRIPEEFVPSGKRCSGGRVLHRVLIYNTKPIE